MSEERHPIRALVITVLYLVFAVGIVWFLITTIKADVPELDFLFNDTRMYVIATGIPMAVLAGTTSYFAKGEKPRMAAGVFAAVSMAFYIFFVLSSLDLGWQEDEIMYTITPSGLLILFMVAVALKGVYHVMEYFTYREEEIPPEQQEKQVYGPQQEPYDQGEQVPNGPQQQPYEQGSPGERQDPSNQDDSETMYY